MSASLRPIRALIVHQRDTEAGHLPAGDTVCSLHGIIQGPDKAPLLDAGRLLTPAEASELADVLRKPAAVNESLTFLAGTLLRSTPSSLTWYRPPGRSRQYWRTGKEHTQINAVLPGLLFHVESGVLSVAAYAGDERPSERTPLYAVPLGNVFSDSLVCVGGATLPNHWEPSATQKWERVLLDTYYSHVNHPNTLAGGATTESLIAFWKRRERYAQPPHVKYLHPMKLTAGAWVMALSSKKVSE